MSSSKKIEFVLRICNNGRTKEKKLAFRWNPVVNESYQYDISNMYNKYCKKTFLESVKRVYDMLVRD